MRSMTAKSMLLGVVALISAAAWSQAAPANSEQNDPNINIEDPMLTPPPISGWAYQVALDAERRPNTLNYGVVFSSAYSDNVFGAVGQGAISDISYSVWPTISLDASTSRRYWNFSYSPGFTFYQRTSSANQADQGASLEFQYRLSPHVTLDVRDTFSKSSSIFNQPSGGQSAVFGGTGGPNDSVIAPVANRMRNYGMFDLTYQYSANDMIGGGGMFGNLHYPDAGPNFGLWDSSAQGGSFFYTHRFSARHYVGAWYEYQHLMSFPNGLDAKTQTHSLFLFYSVFPTPRFSISVFGGPQRADIAEPALISSGIPAFAVRTWEPGAGASLAYQARRFSAALSYSHLVDESGGLISATRWDNASAAVRLQLTRNLAASLGGFYANNKILGDPPGAINGHSISGTVAVSRQIGNNLSVQAGYTRLRQNYAIPVIAAAPYMNRGFVSVAYTFTRPLGR